MPRIPFSPPRVSPRTGLRRTSLLIRALGICGSVVFVSVVSAQSSGSVNYTPTLPPDVSYATFADNSNALEAPGTELDGDAVGRGVAWVDIVGHDPGDPALPGPPDGVLDLVLANSNSPALPLGATPGTELTPAIGTTHSNCKVFRAEPDGTFTDLTFSMGTSGFGFDIAYPGGSPFGVLPADFDNDGDNDLFYPCGAFNTSSINGLLENDGDGTFTYISTTAGGPSQNQVTFGGTWLDIDKDGDLDLYTSNAVDILDPYYNGPANPDPVDRLYRNDGNGNFVDIAASAGTDLRSNSFGVVASDLDKDGWSDVVVSCMQQLNKVFYNNGDLTFEFMAPQGHPTIDLDITLDMAPLPSGAWELINVPMGANQIVPMSGHVSLPAEVADINGDGWPDVFFGVWSAQLPDGNPNGGEGALYAGAERQYLYLNAGDLDGNGIGDGIYREVGLGAGYNHIAGTMGLLVTDVNLDGYPDIYCGNGGPDVDNQLEEDFLYMNNGPTWPKDFVSNPMIPLPQALFEIGAVAGTYSNVFMSHGVMLRQTPTSGTDIYVSNGGPALTNQGQSNIYYENQGDSAGKPYRALEIGLTPDASPPGGIGTRVTISRRAEGGELEIQMQERRGSFGFMSSNFGPLIYGLGGSEPLFCDIEWPTGRRQGRLLLDTLAGQRLDFTETSLSMTAELDMGGANIVIDFENTGISNRIGQLRMQVVRVSPHTDPIPEVPGLNGGTARAAQKRVWAPGPWQDLGPLTVNAMSTFQFIVPKPSDAAPIFFHMAYFEADSIYNAAGLWIDAAGLVVDPDAGAKLAAFGGLSLQNRWGSGMRPTPENPSEALPNLTVLRTLSLEAERLHVKAPNSKLTHTLDLSVRSSLTLDDGVHARWQDGAFQLQLDGKRARIEVGADGFLVLYLGVPEGCCESKFDEPVRILRFEGFEGLRADGTPYSTKLQPIGVRTMARPMAHAETRKRR